MNKTRYLLLLLTSVLSIASSNVTSAATINTDYSVLPVPMDIPNIKAYKLVYVTEFFKYDNQDTLALEPALTNWIKSAPKNIIFDRIPVVTDPASEVMAKLFFTLQKLNLRDRFHTELLTKISQKRLILNTDKDVFDWVKTTDINQEKFNAIYAEYGTKLKVERAISQFKAANTTYPSFVINGEFLIKDKQLKSNIDAPFNTIDELSVLATDEMKKADTAIPKN
jgi:thiol:disulfide interchange protein DsbA